MDDFENGYRLGQLVGEYLSTASEEERAECEGREPPPANPGPQDATGRLSDETGQEER